MLPRTTRRALVATLFFLWDNRQGQSFSFSKSGQYNLGRNIPKFNDNRFVSRKYRRKLRLSSYTSQIERVHTETAEDIPKQHETDGEKTHLSLIPLSRSPLLLSSSNPLINRNDCTILIRYLELLQEGRCKMVDFQAKYSTTQGFPAPRY